MNKIIGYRKMLGFTQTDLAKEFGISLQAYRLKENGTTAFKDSEKVLFKNDVHSVCLPEATQIFPPGEGVVVTGWGALSYDGKLSFE